MKNQFENINPQAYEAVQIALASPEQILSWSHGEVRSSETINYRTFKPEKDGLFCGKIFGPVDDYECICGKYKRMKHRGTTCEKCGVEVIKSDVRRERLGHIELATPVSHIWFLKGLPSKMACFLGMSLKDLEKVLYFDCYLVLEPGESGLQMGDVIEESKYYSLSLEDEDLVAGMGGEAVKQYIETFEVQELVEQLREELRESNSEAKRKKIIKRLKVVDAFLNSNIQPTNMVLEVIPVISPDLRPLVPLDGGRFATSDLNDLYRRVIHRNNRLKRLIGLSAPDIIVKNEKRMLQEAVDALFDNGRRGRTILGTNRRPLKSLSDSLKGKYGRFRQNLLGKRVDYSGRTVIVVGPDLKLNQCGLPKKMALEFFKPFIYQHLIKNEKAATIKIAKKMIESNEPEVWTALDEVILEHPILLNRAPTLHRLGIQAFEPTLIEGKAVQLHPLVCTAFNADFDGDQIAIHVPLSIEAQMEAKVLIMSTNNILSSATGKPIMTPSLDMILGLYWLTKEIPNSKGEGSVFSNIEQVLNAQSQDFVNLHAKIRVRIGKEIFETTPGRITLYSVLPEAIEFKQVNRLLKKRDIEDLVDYCYRHAGSVKTVFVLDAIKKLGFETATKAGFSISMADMTIPDSKERLLKQAFEKVREIQTQHQDGIITDGERYNKVIDIWSKVTEDIANDMIEALSQEKDEKGNYKVNPIFAMADSGARSSISQSKQLSGMRGLMAKPTGEIIETPITANFREGLSVHQYFISTHGARKGLADTALKTARSGYLTRRLVDVAQDMIVSLIDCGTTDGIVVEALVENGEIVEQLAERLLGRIIAESLVDPYTKETIIEEGEPLDEQIVAKIESLGFEKVKIRSALTCDAQAGLCAKCYGRDLGRYGLVTVGEAVGVIAAQSIGEPGTQLTMRTFHIGGAANRQVEQTSWEASKAGKLSLKNVKMVKNRDGIQIVMNRMSEAVIMDDLNREIENQSVPIGTKLLLNDGQVVNAGQRIAEWDPFSIPILTDVDGCVKYVDVIDGKSMHVQTDDVTGLVRQVIQESSKQELKPRIMIQDEKTQQDVSREDGKTHAGFSLPSKAELIVREGDIIKSGDVLAKIPRETAKNKDITGGLPRVVDLFEARIPKLACVISEIDGTVEFGESVRRKQRIIVRPTIGEPREYLVAKNQHIIVFEDDVVKAGDPLTDGSANPHDILRVQGVKNLQSFLVDEVQQVYRLQGVKINDKHIEVIIKQMLNKVEISDAGDSTFLIGEAVSKKKFKEMNQRLELQGLEKAEAMPILLGITKAALNTDSFISAASFQETTKVLTEASIEGRYDTFNGLKENVIIGRLIPAGTGFFNHKTFDYQVEGEPTLQEVSEETESLQAKAGLSTISKTAN